MGYSLKISSKILNLISAENLREIGPKIYKCIHYTIKYIFKFYQNFSFLNSAPKKLKLWKIAQFLVLKSTTAQKLFKASNRIFTLTFSTLQNTYVNISKIFHRPDQPQKKFPSRKTNKLCHHTSCISPTISNRSTQSKYIMTMI